jgi:TetR/AcrR family transcriptional repressor of nem operon
MGRTKTFDTAQVVRAARGVFWAHGFEDTSLPALQEATGLSTSSIYHSFGSKRGLFDAAVESYLDEVARPRWRPLVAETVDRGALADYLSSLRGVLLTPGTFPADHGCLLIRSASGAIAADEVVARTVRAYCDELRAAIGRGVDASRPDLDPASRGTLAQACTGLVIAAFSLVRVDPAQSGRCLDAALALLDQP